MRNAAEHFDWAAGRAMEYVEMGDGANAMASLVSDLGKHEGTAGILTPDLQMLLMGEVMIGGAQGARRFIEGLPRPRKVTVTPLAETSNPAAVDDFIATVAANVRRITEGGASWSE